MHTQSRRHFSKNAAILSLILIFLPPTLAAGAGPEFRVAFTDAGYQVYQYKDPHVNAVCITNTAVTNRGKAIHSVQKTLNPH